MKVSCARKELYEGLQTVARAVSSRSSLPILSNILLEPGTDGIKLAATDLELGLECRMQATVHEGGPITVPARTFQEIVAALPEAEVTIAADDHHNVILTCRRSEYRIHGLPAVEFPPLPEVTGDLSFSMPQGVLREMIRQTILAVSPDDTRPVLTGIYLVLAGERLTFAATDTHRLAVRAATLTDVQAGASGPEAAVIVPERAMNELMRLLGAGSEEPVSVKVDQNQILFRTETACLVSRLIEGTFPKYERVIPTQHTKKLTIPVEEFGQSVKRAAIVARDNANRLVLRTDGENLVIRAEAGDLGQAYEEIEVLREGDDIEIAFNARYLLDILGVLETEGLYLEMTEPLSPAVIRPVGDEQYLMVIMPMQLA
jgi:DNA polymerase-3 subunit beta